MKGSFSLVKGFLLLLGMSVLGIVLPYRVAHADVAGGGMFAAGIALTAILILGVVVAAIAGIAYLVIRSIAKKNDNR